MHSHRYSSQQLASLPVGQHSYGIVFVSPLTGGGSLVTKPLSLPLRKSDLKQQDGTDEG